jgi:hypothetical protein
MEEDDNAGIGSDKVPTDSRIISRRRRLVFRLHSRTRDLDGDGIDLLLQ